MAGLVAAALERDDVVVSVGGDGMLSSLAGSVSRRGRDPCRAPRRPRQRLRPDARAARVAPTTWPSCCSRPSRARSTCCRSPSPAPTDRRVAGSVYSGVDARASEIVDRAHWLPRKLQYPYAAIRSLATYRPGRYRVTVDGVAAEYSAANVVVANSGYYGKGMHIAPDAAVDDGVLDVVIIEAASRWELIRSLPKVYDGRHIALPEVTVLTGRRVEVAADARTPVPVGGDGEPLGTLPGLDAQPAVIEVLPGALSILA